MGNKKVLSPNNIWSKEGFQMCGLGEKSKTITRIKHISKCIRWSYQRIAGGYLGKNYTNEDEYDNSSFYGCH